MSFITCATTCGVEIPATPGNCKITTREGGISKLIFIACDADMPTDPSDLAQWQLLIDDCKIRISTELRGQKPKGTITTAVLSSCKGEQKIGATKTITFASYASYQGLYEYDFWKFIDENQASLNVMAVGCDGRIYPATEFTIDIDEVVEELKTGSSYFDGVISIVEKNIMKPFFIPGLVALLDANSNFDCSLLPTPGPLVDAPAPAPTTLAEIIL